MVNKVNSIGSGVYLNIKQNVSKEITNPETGIRSIIADKSAYLVKLSVEALKLLLQTKKLEKVLPKQSSKELTLYNNKGKMIGTTKEY